jgi:hypothetical protein
METETISARNVVDLLLDEKFGSGICGPRVLANVEEEQQQQEPSAATTAESAEAEQAVFQAAPEAEASETATTDESKSEPVAEPEVIGVTTGQVKDEKKPSTPKEFVYGWDCP